jgi:hypothetical protein
VLNKALAASITTLIGIYGCELPVGLLPTTSRCYRITSFSAPTEWILALCWISYLFAVGYDLYHAEHVAEAIINLTGRRGQPAQSPSAAMRALRLAKVLENDDEGMERTTHFVGSGKSKYASVQSQELTD